MALISAFAIKAIFPSLKQTDVVFMMGDYLQVEAEGDSPITFIPPSMYGPPEFVHVDWKDTADPGLVIREHGPRQGGVAALGSGRHLLPPQFEAHSGLMSDLMDSMLPSGRQLKTDAHPLVEITFMRQGNRHLLQFLDLSGHADTAYFNPIRMTNIKVSVKGSFQSAHAIRSAKTIAINNKDGYASLAHSGTGGI